jgi:hypothetical protein
MISEAQRAALAKLAPVLAPDFYLAGGVAIAAHLDHRTSRDLDVFAPSDPTRLLPELEQLPGVTVTSTAAGTVELDVDGVPTSLLQYRYPTLSPPAPVAGLPIPVAALDDLVCMKLSAVASRGAARDFWDLHAIIGFTRRSLSEWVQVFVTKHPKVDIGHLLRSLVYFGQATPLPTGLDPAHWARIRADFEAWVKALMQPGP